MAWSHGSRFDLARRLVAARAGGRLLDYGCGDGTFVAMVHADFAETRRRRRGAAASSRECRGAARPPARRAVRDDARRRGRRGGRAPLGRRDLHGGAGALPGGRSAAACSTSWRGSRRPAGSSSSACPIEIGPSLAGKQFFRALAAMRGHGDYEHRERYSPVEMIRCSIRRGRSTSARRTGRPRRTLRLLRSQGIRLPGSRARAGRADDNRAPAVHAFAGSGSRAEQPGVVCVLTGNR